MALAASANMLPHEWHILVLLVNQYRAVCCQCIVCMRFHSKFMLGTREMTGVRAPALFQVLKGISPEARCLPE